MSSTYYLGITPLQEPYDPDALDAAGRCMAIFTVLATKRLGGNTFLRDLLAIAEAANVGQVNVDMFGGKASTIPAGPGPYLHLKQTGGAPPLGTHNDGTGAYRRPSALVTVHASTWTAAEGMAQAAYAAWAAFKNQTLELAP